MQYMYKYTYGLAILTLRTVSVQFPEFRVVDLQNVVDFDFIVIWTRIKWAQKAFKFVIWLWTLLNIVMRHSSCCIIKMKF